MNLKITKWIFTVLFLTSCTTSAVSDADQMPQPSVAVVEMAVSEADLTKSTAVSTASTQWSQGPDPLQIEVMRDQNYVGNPITIEETLTPGTNYNRYRVSYISESYTIYALMTVPFGSPPDTGWPVILFNHGYINPPDYRTAENYVTYMDMLASSGYIVFKSDFRGHGNSAGPIVGGGYGSPGYTADVLNAMESLKNYEGVDPDRFGIWGHSMGGQVTLRAMVVSDEIKAGVIWAGAIAPLDRIITQWNPAGRGAISGITDFLSDVVSERNDSGDGTVQGWWSSFGSWVNEFTVTYGTAEQNPEFWATISPNSFLTDVSGPVQIHHGTDDHMVPLSWSQEFVREMQNANMPVEFYIYEGDDHNLSNNYREAMQRTLAFFDKYVKGD
jgi:alpha-beta hydrolase superfamily lysophospholipase